jgi:uncharacterized membrane protein YqiK
VVTLFDVGGMVVVVVVVVAVVAVHEARVKIKAPNAALIRCERRRDGMRLKANGGGVLVAFG